MRVSVIGTGYLGAVHAAALAEMGHDVVGVDVDSAKIAQLAAGIAPFHEPGFADLLQRQLAAGALTFTTDLAAAADAEAHFICVGTPQSPAGGHADLRFVWQAVHELAPLAAPNSVVIGKSTVPVGTAAQVRAYLDEHRGAEAPRLAWNPEFLREGFAVADSLRPDRVVVGIAPGDDRAASVLRAIYDEQLAAGIPYLAVDIPTAELVKVAANAFLATKISFINAMAELCEAAGGDVGQLADAIGLDARIGRRFLNAGLGYGGGCLPKDVRALAASAEDLGCGQAAGVLRWADTVNQRRRHRVVQQVTQLSGGSVAGKRVAVLGAAFKPDTDDVRDSPGLGVAALLAGVGADAVVLATEWPLYRELDPAQAASWVRTPVLVDSRNTLDHAAWQAAGWTGAVLGRNV